MHKIILILIAFIFISVGCNSKKQNQNAENLNKIKIGMNVKEVINIMGKPDTIITDKYNDDIFRYLYISSSGHSDNFYIFFSNQDSIVTRINNGL